MITQEQFDEFVRHYNWEVIRNADYRVGQAFVNYFNNATLESIDTQYRLFYNTNNEDCWKTIRKLVK